MLIKTFIFLFSLLSSGISYAITIENVDGFANIQSQMLQYENQFSIENESQTDQLKSIILNSGFDLKINNHKLKANAVLRYFQTSLLKEDANLLRYSAVPTRLIGRDFFKFRHIKEDKNSLLETTFNELFYTWEGKDARVKMGRIPVSFGKGKSINPINPLNFNAELATQPQIAQGNDGAQISLTKDSRLKLHIYIFADKAFTDYDEKLTNTLMLRGEWKLNETAEINYILGEDQNRHKYGLEVSKDFKFANAYAQIVRHSQRLEEDQAGSEGLAHYLVGLESPLSQTWNIGLELGKFEQDEKDSTSQNPNFLPFQDFATIFNRFRINDELQTSLNLTSDANSGASFYEISVTYKDDSNFELMAFSTGLGSEPSDKTRFANESSVPSNFGLNFKYKF